MRSRGPQGTISLHAAHAPSPLTTTSWTISTGSSRSAATRTAPRPSGTWRGRDSGRRPWNAAASRCVAALVYVCEQGATWPSGSCILSGPHASCDSRRFICTRSRQPVEVTDLKGRGPRCASLRRARDRRARRALRRLFLVPVDVTTKLTATATDGAPPLADTHVHRRC